MPEERGFEIDALSCKRGNLCPYFYFGMFLTFMCYSVKNFTEAPRFSFVFVLEVS